MIRTSPEKVQTM